MKVKKIAGVLLSITGALVILVLCTFLFWLGPTVKLVAEKVGSKALGTPVTVNELSINPRSGMIHLSDFAIANPDTYGRSNAVSLASLDVSIDMGSIFTRTVVVHEVSINSPYFIYEQSVATDNIEEFIQSVQEFLGYDPEAPPPPPDPEKEEKERRKKEKMARKRAEKGPKVVIVESLAINDVQLHLANTEDPRLDVDVSIEALALSMTNGTASLKNLRITSPERLDTPYLFTLAAVDVAVDPATIYSDTLSILDVQVIRPYAYLEHNPQADTVSEFMKIAERFIATTNAPAVPAVATPEESIPEESADRPPPIALHHLLVDDIQVQLLDTTVTNASPELRLLAGIDAISVKLVEGNIQIKAITVPNPPGFVSSNLFHLANINITVEPESVFSPQTVVQEIFVNSPRVHLEQTETSGNAGELKDTLMGFMPPATETGGAPAPEGPGATGAGSEPIPLAEQPVVLRNLIITNMAVNLSLPVDTNTPAVGHGQLRDKASLENVSLSKLNPLHRSPDGTAGATNNPAPAETPLKLLSFGRLHAVPLEGMVRISNLQVSNPKGFANEHLVKIEQFRMELDPDSLQSDTLLVRDILIDKPRIAYERKITTDNIKTLQAEIEKAVARRKEYREPEALQEDTESPAGENDAQKVIIEHLLVDGGLVRAKLSALPSAPIPLPNIEMKDMGKAEGGTSLGEAASSIWDSIYDAIIGTVSSATGFASDALKGAGALTFGTLGSATGLTSDKAKAEKETPAEAAVPPAVEPEEAEEAEEPKRRGRLFRRKTGRFF